MPKNQFVDFKAVKSAVSMEQVLQHYGLLDKLDAKHAYLFERGLTSETIEDFGIGYCSLKTMDPFSPSLLLRKAFSTLAAKTLGRPRFTARATKTRSNLLWQMDGQGRKTT